MVELFFGRLTDKAIRRGLFHSVPDLIDAIETYLAAHNQDPQPFTWTATTEQILTRSAANESPSMQSTTKTETVHEFASSQDGSYPARQGSRRGDAAERANDQVRVAASNPRSDHVGPSRSDLSAHE